MRYDERKLHSVSFGMLSPTQAPDGETVIGTSVFIYVSSQGGDSSGPCIEVNFAFPASKDTTLGELREKSVLYAYELVQRIARESFEDIRVASEATPLFDFTKD